MSKVQLIPLAVTDLSMKYARRLEGNKILHYRVSAISRLAGIGGMGAFETVAEYIKQNEGLEAVLVENANKMPTQKGGPIEVEDMTERVLSALPKVRRALKKRTVTGQLYQYTEPMTLKDRENEATSYVDRQGQTHQVKKTPKWKIIVTQAFYALGLEKLLPNSIHCAVRRVTPVSYLTYCYEQPDEAKAISQMQEDLKKLQERNLIMGHLTMPSTITMADTVGAGIPRKVLFAFVVVNQPEICRQFNKNPLELSRKPLQDLLGVKGESFEGELGYNITPGKYEIEIVDVNPQALLTSERIHQAVRLNYLQNVDHVNEAAKRQRDYMKNVHVETSSVNRDGKVYVDMKISKKSDE